jgi:hypothetical protein
MYGMFKVVPAPNPAGPASTLIDTTLAAAEAMVCPLPPEERRLSPLPPQAVRKVTWIRASR